MKARQAFVAALAAILLASCAATSATNTLPQARRDALRFDSIELSFAPDAVISWPDAMSEFANSGTPDSPAARRAFLERKAAGRIRAALDAEIRPAFRGTDPARLKVAIRRLEVPSAIQRILVGGSNALRADILVVDAKTGQPLLNAPDFNGVASGGSGLVQVAVEQMFPDPIDRVSRVFASALKGWLQTGQALSTGAPGAALRSP
jgi:hypothetical protein